MASSHTQAKTAPPSDSFIVQCFLQDGAAQLIRLVRLTPQTATLPFLLEQLYHTAGEWFANVAHPWDAAVEAHIALGTGEANTSVPPLVASHLLTEQEGFRFPYMVAITPMQRTATPARAPALPPPTDATPEEGAAAEGAGPSDGPPASTTASPPPPEADEVAPAACPTSPTPPRRSERLRREEERRRREAVEARRAEAVAAREADRERRAAESRARCAERERALRQSLSCERQAEDDKQRRQAAAHAAVLATKAEEQREFFSRREAARAEFEHRMTTGVESRARAHEAPAADPEPAVDDSNPSPVHTSEGRRGVAMADLLEQLHATMAGDAVAAEEEALAERDVVLKSARDAYYAKVFAETEARKRQRREADRTKRVEEDLSQVVFARPDS